jgi:hypothetical protein
MSQAPPAVQKNSFISNLAASALSASFAEVCTIPIDTAKVRLQLQPRAAAGVAPKYSGMFGTMMTVAREEGVGALWKGITPGESRSPLPLPPCIAITHARKTPNDHRTLFARGFFVFSIFLHLARARSETNAEMIPVTLTACAGIHRQILFGGLRIGLYEPVKNFYCGPDHVVSEKQQRCIYWQIIINICVGMYSSPTSQHQLSNSLTQVLTCLLASPRVSSCLRRVRCRCT